MCFIHGEHTEFTKPPPITLRSGVSASDLRRLVRLSKDAPQARRLLARAVIYGGGKRTEAARLGNVAFQIVRDWVVRFNAEGPEGLLDRKASGPRPILTNTHRQALAAGFRLACAIMRRRKAH